ncbi:hypothetical protein COCSUDRAFT_31923 [Coccomyxa subellipsoidea C-169]|uniref:Uncharacterized protein n=1 Tax=Coccomyxa subellipsoidea (strain C-169) TaxID=574566 RepID=I0Z8X6_COCSC|nr:hypothetical protein COCSUDRAFT_31923 [Coccomyxa subellipsoidea C-169]EIE27095.1 hypothetical protein COCSUDRAFT_31923 [Coccomyxa subellipsoidea C-169]|eukprot:XP_005651639.1 hypothetical protein COCSUDRAFT_31923 [Coccomyxa subellipsoidea C-169]
MKETPPRLEGPARHQGASITAQHTLKFTGEVCRLSRNNHDLCHKQLECSMCVFPQP